MYQIWWFSQFIKYIVKNARTTTGMTVVIKKFTKITTSTSDLSKAQKESYINKCFFSNQTAHKDSYIK